MRSRYRGAQRRTRRAMRAEEGRRGRAPRAGVPHPLAKGSAVCTCAPGAPLGEHTAQALSTRMGCGQSLPGMSARGKSESGALQPAAARLWRAPRLTALPRARRQLRLHRRRMTYLPAWRGCPSPHRRRAPPIRAASAAARRREALPRAAPRHLCARCNGPRCRADARASRRCRRRATTTARRR
jgi:hypothetical protein